MLLGEISALAAALFWSGNTIALTEATHRIGSVSVNIARMVLASVYLIITIGILGYSLELSFSQYYNLIISGFVGLVFGDTFLFKCFQYIGPRLGMLLMSLSPPIAGLMAYIFLGEILSIWGIIGIIITIFGVSIVILERNTNKKGYHFNARGILYGILAAIGQAVGLIFVKFAFNEGPVNEFSATFVRLSSAVLLLFLLARFTGKFKHPIRMFKNDPVALKHTVIASLLGPYLGITASLIAVANTYVGIAATLMSTVPIMMLPISKYYYKESLSWKSILGAFVAVGGISILFLK